MLFNNKFLKIALVGFIAFAIIKTKNLPLQKGKEEVPQFEFLNDVKSTFEVLTAEPKNRLTTQKKDSPILNVNYDNTDNASTSIKPTDENQLETKPIKKPPPKRVDYNSNLPDNPYGVPGPADGQIEPQSWLEHKIINIADNLLHTPQGQELLEKFLLNRDNVPNGPNGTKTIKDPHHNNSTFEISPGSGPHVQCGDIVTAHYTTRLVNGQEVENTHYKEQPLTFQVGNGQVIKGLEYAVLNMQAGGKRRLVVPPKMGYKDPKHSKMLVAGNEFITVDVELISIDPEFQNLDSKIRIFENPNTDFPIIMCSDPVFFRYKLMTMDNKIIASSDKAVSFILGSEQVPAAINRAFTNLTIRGKRTVILPSKYIYNKSISFIPKNTKIPANEFLLLEIDTN